MKFRSILEKLKTDLKQAINRIKGTLRDAYGRKLDIEYILEKEINNLYGYEFYKIVTALKLDLDVTSRKAFANIHIKTNRTKQHSSKLTKIQRFVYQFITEQKDFANNAGIDPTRLSKILKGDRKDFFAFEVYSIALSQSISISSAFEQLYKEN